MKKRIIGALVLVVTVLNVQAAKLDPAKWTVKDEAVGKSTAAVTDNNTDTCWTGSGDKGLLIDLGQETVVHRIYFTPGAGITDVYARVRLSFLRTPDDTQGVTRVYHRITCEPWKVAEQRRKLQATGEDFLSANKADVNLKFDPISARYLRIEGATPLAELEVYGSADKAAFAKKDAVVLGTNAPDILRVAAEDLRYCIGELSGRPLPIITPAQESEYPGTLYKVMDLKPLATNFTEMKANILAGKLPNGSAKPEFVTYPTWSFGWHSLKLPDGVNVEREGREVLFKAWPYRNVLFSAWEFLRRQGVNWVASDDHGDVVPAGKGVDLGILPLRYRPSSDLRIGSGDGSSYYLLRSGYNVIGGGNQLLDAANEVPPIPEGQIRGYWSNAAKDLNPLYQEGFFASPHNLHAVVPNRLLEEHPEWCGMGLDGQRKAPSKGGPATFCFTSPEVIKFVADKMVYWSGDNPDCAAGFRLVPLDGASFCQCPKCKELCQPYMSAGMGYCIDSSFAFSGPYYYFITEVAKLVKAQRPHVVVEALAYADYTPPPPRIGKFQDNTTVQVCVYGARNLPLSSSPANAETRAYLEEWARRGVPLTHWDYLLIHAEWRDLSIPVPMVTAIADRARYLSKLGMWNGLCQADNGSLAHNPWNRYAHPRLLWNVNLTADQLLDEFFTGYYQEAKGPMLAYYKALEDHLIKNDVSLEDFAYDLGPNPDMFTPELITVLRGHLENARLAVTPWYVKKRVDLAAKDLENAIPAASRRSLDKATALRYGKKEYVCGRRNGDIKVDGTLDDAGWKSAAVAGGFTLPGSGAPAAADQRTEFRMAWDDGKLYVGIRCANTNMANLKPTENVWGTDCLEFFLVPERAYRPAYYQSAISAFGKTWGPKRFINDQWHKSDGEMQAFETSATPGANEWTCEIVIPFAALKEGAPKPGDSWRMNMVRNTAGGGCWSSLPIRMWHLTKDFDFLTFKE